MRYVSLFSGIEAASVAFGPLGWEPLAFAEIEPFPSAVLAHHYPGVPNVGDMTAHDWSQYRGRCELVVGGPPCQAFSVAGLRRSLDDDRGNLSLSYVKAIHAIEPAWSITENVPGWLSTKDNAFGCFLGALVGADAPLDPPEECGWTDAGVVSGPARSAAWRVLDAQFFGLAQRRRRVFVLSVRGTGDWRPAEALFPVAACLRGDPPPRRAKAAEAPGGARSSAAVSSGNGWWDEGDAAGTLRRECDRASVASTLILPALPFDTTQITSAANRSAPAPGDPSHPLAAGAHPPAIAFQCHGTNVGEMGTLRAGNGNETGGVPFLPVAFHVTQDPISSSGATPALGCGNALGCGTLGVATPIGFRSTHSNGGFTEDGSALTLSCSEPHAIAVPEEDCRAYAAEADAASMLRVLRREVGAEAFAEWGHRVLAALQSPEVLRAWLHGESLRRSADDFRAWVDDRPLPRAEGVPAGAMRVVWSEGPDGRSPQGRGLAKQLAHQLGAALPELPSAHAPQPVMAVRRLTPVECARLQGFPDHYLDIPWKGGMAPDGPKYRALGNSMAVPVMAWIGRRIALVDAVVRSHSEAA